jgi:phosphatidylglycerol phospholipase C
VSYARQFLKVPGVSFNMLQKIMVGPFGNAFLQDVKRSKRAIFLWTVNEEEWMKWSIGKEVDAVITDEPKRYLEICETYQGEKIHYRWKLWGSVLWTNLLVVVFSLLFRYKYGFKIEASKARKAMEISSAETSS